MKQYFEELSKKQKQFILDELNITEEQYEGMNDEEFSDIYDKVCDIEVEETIEAGEGELSERGKMAESIVTIVGNAMAEDEGFYED